jgi:hypothetical protein
MGPFHGTPRENPWPDCLSTDQLQVTLLLSDCVSPLITIAPTREVFLAPLLATPFRVRHRRQRLDARTVDAR